MIDASAFSKEDILSPEIIEVILQTDDYVTQAMTINALSDRAKELHCKQGFDNLLKAIKKSNKMANARAGMTDFGMPVYENGIDKYPQLRCGEWTADDNGVFRYGMLGQRLDACSHPVFPVKLLRNAQEDRVKVVLAFKRSDGWREITIDKSVIASASRIVALSDQGIMVTSENSKQLVAFLEALESYNPELIKFYTSTSKLGWTAAGFMPYCDNIVFDAENSVTGVFTSIAQKGDYEQWKTFVRRLRTKKRMEIQLYMAAAFASPYIAKLNLLPFIVDLYGATGNGKTVCAMIATSIWANPEQGKYITKAGGTLTSLEVYLDLLNNLPAVIDDFAQIKKQSKRDGTDFSDYVYMLCSGSSKGRSNVNLGLQRTRNWRNCILTNSEQSLITDTSQGGMVNRIIEYESIDTIFDKGEGRRTAEFVQNNYGFAGKDFIDLVDITELRSLWDEFYEWIINRSNETGDNKEEKQVAPMALLLAIDKLATDLIFQDGLYMDKVECYNLLKNHEQVSEYDRAYETLLELIGIRQNQFNFDQWNKECLGKFITTGAKREVAIVNAAFNGICEELAVSPVSFKKWLSRNHKIRTCGQNCTVSIRIGGEIVRCVVIELPAESVEDFVPAIEEQELPFV